MSSRKNVFVTSGFALAISLVAAAVAVLLASYHYSRFSFDLLNAVCGEIEEQEPETRKIISAALKEYTEGNSDGVLEGDVLSILGYRASDFSGISGGQTVFFAAIGFVAGLSLFFFTFLYRNKMEIRRIRALTEYLEQVNNGKAVILSTSGEDDFSKLEDEIYKTVTCLVRTREQAVQAKNGFAENLSNIAHQIKTPITAISLSVQKMKQCFGRKAPGYEEKQNSGGKVPEDAGNLRFTRKISEDAEKFRFVGKNLEQVEKQLARLTYLEEALLILSRLDAGTLLLQKEETDVFTLLVLAADNLQELFAGSGTSIEIPDQEKQSDPEQIQGPPAGTSIEIPEQGKMRIIADADWTMEALMNLMKNCMEHNRGGVVHCSYAQNPLYTEILIWDEGEGFAEEEIPHLFERFYRGKNAGEGGIGIGLALAKEIIERQNGTIRAKNRPGGGALFEIRFYTL